MWQHILALPLVAKIIGFLGVAALGVLAWAKHKAIAEVTGAATKTAESKLLGWFGNKLYAAAPPPTVATATPNTERTYRGAFLAYSRYANSKEHFFTIERDGVIETVSVTQTNKLSAVRRGDFVEIDTQVGVYYGEEVVQRVRVGKSQQPRGPFAKGDAGY